MSRFHHLSPEHQEQVFDAFVKFREAYENYQRGDLASNPLDIMALVFMRGIAAGRDDNEARRVFEDQERIIRSLENRLAFVLDVHASKFATKPPAVILTNATPMTLDNATLPDLPERDDPHADLGYTPRN